MTDEELRDEIAELLCVVADSKISKIEGTKIKVDQIHSLYKQAGYVQLAKDQSLPENPYTYRSKHSPTPNENLENGCSIGFSRAVDDMLKDKFQKVEL